MNVAVQAGFSYPPVPVGAVPTVPSSVTLRSLPPTCTALPSAYSVNTTLAPWGAVVVPSAFFHAFSAFAVVSSCVFVIVSPVATGSVVLGV